MKCPTHPEFDPQNRTQFESSRKFMDCRVCCGLHYGALPIGDFGGEYHASPRDKDVAKTILGPMDLEQFGHARHSLGHDFHMSDGPSWRADAETRTIYFDRTFGEHALKEFKKYKCRVAIRTWSEPTLKEIGTVKGEKETSFILTIGSADQALVLTLKQGMTVPELREAFSDFGSQLFDIPKDGATEQVFPG